MQPSNDVGRPEFGRAIIHMALVAGGAWLAVEGAIASGVVVALGGLTMLVGDLSARMRKVTDAPAFPVMAVTALAIAFLIDLAIDWAGDSDWWWYVFDVAAAAFFLAVAAFAWRHHGERA